MIVLGAVVLLGLYGELVHRATAWLSPGACALILAVGGVAAGGALFWWLAIAAH